MKIKCSSCGYETQEGLLICPECLKDRKGDEVLKGKKEDAVISIFHAPSEQAADFIKTFLENEKIECVIRKLEIPMYPRVGTFLYGELQVKKEDVKEALEIIDNCYK